MVAAAFVNAHPGGSSATAGTTISCTIDSANSVAIGNLLVLYVVSGNLSSTTPTFTVSVPTGIGETAAWQTDATARHNSNSATSGNATVGQFFWIRPTVTWPAASSFIVTLSASVVQKMVSLAEWSGPNGILSDASSTTGNAVAVSVSSGVGTGDLCVAVADEKRATTPFVTADTDTTAGSWQTVGSFNNGGGSSGVSGIMQYKIPTSGGTQTFNSTLGGQGGAVIAHFIVPFTITTNRVFLWNVIQTLSISKVLKWNVIQTLLTSRVLKWNVATVLSVARVFKWNVIVSGLTNISISRILKWNVIQTLQSSRIFKWNVSIGFSTSRAFKWNVRVGVIVSKIFKWNVWQQVIVPRVFKWAVFKQVLISRVLKWNVTGGLLITRSFLWNVFFGWVKIPVNNDLWTKINENDASWTPESVNSTVWR